MWKSTSLSHKAVSGMSCLFPWPIATVATWKRWCFVWCVGPLLWTRLWLQVCCQFDFRRLPEGGISCPWRISPQRITDSNVAERWRDIEIPPPPPPHPIHPSGSYNTPVLITEPICCWISTGRRRSSTGQTSCWRHSATTSDTNGPLKLTNSTRTIRCGPC